MVALIYRPTGTDLYVTLDLISSFNKKIEMSSSSEFLSDNDQEEKELVRLVGFRSKASARGSKPTSAMEILLTELVRWQTDLTINMGGRLTELARSTQTELARRQTELARGTFILFVLADPEKGLTE